MNTSKSGDTESSAQRKRQNQHEKFLSSLSPDHRVLYESISNDEKAALDTVPAIDRKWYLAVCNAAADIANLQSEKEYKVSNVIHGKHEYVDLVIGGGAMLGMAAAGYIHALEKANIRFRAIAGTSSGAISAALLMSLGPPRDEKGLRLAAIFANMPINEFLGVGPARLIFWLNSKKTLRWAAVVVLVLWSVKILLFHYLISGKEFEQWLEKKLITLAELNGDSGEPEFWSAAWDEQFSKEHRNLKPKLAVITADITRERIIELPAMAHEFNQGTQQVGLARFVRASTSVPIAFKPVKMTLPDKEAVSSKTDTHFGKKPPKSVKLVDGGLMSNFPIATFHRRDAQKPEMPTFGVKFDPKSKKTNKTFWFWQYVRALVKTGLDVSDDEFIKQHPDYSRLVTSIDTNGIDPLNVYMDRDEKLQLFALGVEAGRKFLKGFNWDNYRRIRSDLHIT